MYSTLVSPCAVSILTRVTLDWCIYASARTLVGPQRFILGSICPSTPFEHYRRSPARPNELRTRKTFGVCRTRMSQCTCINGPFFPHFDDAKEKRSFRTDWQHPASCRAFGAIDFDNLQSHNWSVRYPTWFLIEATWALRTSCPHARW